MKVLFLDVDGVLNRAGTQERAGPYVGVDQELANILIDWLPDDVSIVLSSSWRLPYLHEDMKGHLAKSGVCWIDETPYGGYDSRGHEIKAWLALHPEATEFAILDDINDMGPVLPYLVQTDPDEGLTPAHLDVVGRILRL